MVHNGKKIKKVIMDKRQQIVHTLSRNFTRGDIQGATDELLSLEDVSQQSEPFINFAKEVIEYWEKYDIGDEDIYNKARKLINGG
jgi:hypothetical protein